MCYQNDDYWKDDNILTPEYSKSIFWIFYTHFSVYNFFKFILLECKLKNNLHIIVKNVVLMPIPLLEIQYLWKNISFV